MHDNVWQPNSKKSRMDKGYALNHVNDDLILHVNLEGFKSYAVDVEAEIALLERMPGIVLLDETKLDEIAELDGYILICERNRVFDTKERGIEVFARKDKAAHVTLLGKSDTCERCWVMIHNDGPFLGGCWYRPPNKGSIEGINELRDEIAELLSNSVGIIIIGDISIHSVKWLRHSSGETREANALQTVCEELSEPSTASNCTHPPGFSKLK